MTYRIWIFLSLIGLASLATASLLYRLNCASRRADRVALKRSANGVNL